MRDYLQTILEPLLSVPEVLVISETQDQMGVLLTVEVAKVDMGIIIGKAGETASAIRALMRVYGGKNHARVSCKFLEPVGGRYEDIKNELRKP